ncbi:hypothetical protein, conserved [Eimeria acervulina]|uniref:non-specific serine/threonine protein kinase n=1 Tax=Eimeria acervulina TaxID=5801 RepID=U6GAW7_EIMAC|nr:hypothetical protein, conserved [Eimeria acervulina]CDI77416.1 hypothetical protein, conserved [Eimeria acervulina]
MLSGALGDTSSPAHSSAGVWSAVHTEAPSTPNKQLQHHPQQQQHHQKHQEQQQPQIPIGDPQEQYGEQQQHFAGNEGQALHARDAQRRLLRKRNAWASAFSLFLALLLLSQVAGLRQQLLQPSAPPVGEDVKHALPDPENPSAEAAAAGEEGPGREEELQQEAELEQQEEEEQQQQQQQQQDFDLPAVGSEEERLSPEVLEGKAFLARALSELELVRAAEQWLPAASREAEKAVRHLAAFLSGGEDYNIVGKTLPLESLKPFRSSRSSSSNISGDAAGAARYFTVTRFLGEWNSSIVLEVRDQPSNQLLAVVIPFASIDPPSKNSSSSSSKKGAKEDANAAADELADLVEEFNAIETRGIEAALGDMPAAAAADLKGWAVPLATGCIQGLERGLFASGVYISGKVQITERYHGDLEELIASSIDIPLSAKIYCAQRLLLQVLHLQQQGVTHNDLKLSSCYVRADGSFLLGDFTSSSVDKATLKYLAGITPAYGEPEFLNEIYQEMEKATVVAAGRGAAAEGLATATATTITTERSKRNRGTGKVSADLKCDIWSVGVLIYELFTEQLPYDISQGVATPEQMEPVVQNLINENPSSKSILIELNKAHVPKRWAELLEQMLQVRRKNRIDAANIAKHFSDLFEG